MKTISVTRLDGANGRSLETIGAMTVADDYTGPLPVLGPDGLAPGVMHYLRVDVVSHAGIDSPPE